MKSIPKSKLLNALLIITSLVGYLEWGTNNSVFLAQAEADIVLKLFTEPNSVVHPFTILPLAGQIILLSTLFLKRPGNLLTFIGMAGIGILLVFMFLIGSISLNYKILFSTIPFLFIVLLTIRHAINKQTRSN